MTRRAALALTLVAVLCTLVGAVTFTLGIGLLVVAGERTAFLAWIAIVVGAGAVVWCRNVIWHVADMRTAALR